MILKTTLCWSNDDGDSSNFASVLSHCWILVCLRMSQSKAGFAHSLWSSAVMQILGPEVSLQLTRSIMKLQGKYFHQWGRSSVLQVKMAAYEEAVNNQGRKMKERGGTK